MTNLYSNRWVFYYKWRICNQIDEFSLKSMNFAINNDGFCIKIEGARQAHPFGQSPQVSFQWKNPDFLFWRILISYFEESWFLSRGMLILQRKHLHHRPVLFVHPLQTLFRLPDYLYLSWNYFLNTKLIIFNTRSIMFNAELIIFDTKSIIFKYKAHHLWSKIHHFVMQNSSCLMHTCRISCTTSTVFQRKDVHFLPAGSLKNLHFLFSRIFVSM